MFAEPPSLVGIDGGQMVDEEPCAAAEAALAEPVVVGACVDVLRPSPGS
jgi:hypothetical protein